MALCLVRSMVQFCPHSCLHQILKLNTNPTLNLTLPATHRPAAVLPLLTCQQLTVWQLNVGGILGSLMEPSYCVTAWDYCKGKTHQQHIKQFNIHTEHLLLVRSALFHPHCSVQNTAYNNEEFTQGYGGRWKVNWSFCQPIGLMQWVEWEGRDGQCSWKGRSLIGEL